MRRRLKRLRPAQSFALGLFLLTVAALSILAGTMNARVREQNAQLNNLTIEMRGLDREAENLEMCISQAYDLRSIDERARALGMTDPEESQLRVVRLPASPEGSSVLAVSNTTEETAQE